MVLDVDHVTKSFGRLRAVDDVALQVRQGETLSIIGESGCGKTTLAKVIVGLLAPDQGVIRAQGTVQMVFQDPYTSLDPLYTIQGILAEAFTRQPVPGQAEEIAGMLAAVGLSPEVLPRYPHEFSGGQRQRIAIARALLTRPTVLVLDEITSALDVLVQKQILDLLADLKERLGLTYVFISHNLRVVGRISDTIAVMKTGKILELGPSSQIMTAPAHPYTRTLLSAALSYESPSL